MNIRDFPRGNGGNFVPLEAGTHHAIAIGLIDLGRQTCDFQGEITHRGQLVILFEFPEVAVEIEGVTMPRNLSLKLTKSMHEKSKLRQTLIQWRGRDFTESELNDFDLVKLVGAPATVAVAEKQCAGRTVTFISSVSKPMKGNLFKPSRRIYFDLSDEKTWGAIRELPQWLIDQINASDDCIERGLAFSKDTAEVEQLSDDAQTASDDDSIPF